MAKLYFRYGAMGSSKSANILMVRYNYEERGQYAVLLKPRTDNRDGERKIQSRMGLSASAEYVDEFLKEISQTWKEGNKEYSYQGKKVDAVLVDEAQFLSEAKIDTLSDLVDFYNIPVICYGLRTDFRNRLFPGSRRLMEIADVIEEVPTVCWCGKRAQCNTGMQMEKLYGRVRRSCLAPMKAMWRFAGSTTKKENYGKKLEQKMKRAPGETVKLWKKSKI